MFLTSYPKEKGWEKGSLLTEEGRSAIGRPQDLHTASFVRRHRGVRGEGLVAETYRRFPYYATRSEIAERVLRGDAAALEPLSRAVRSTSKPIAVSTIGYERRILELPQRAASLRSHAALRRSSKPYQPEVRILEGDARERLRRRGDSLRAPTRAWDRLEQRQSLETQEDYDALFAEYERKHLPKQTEALSKIAGWVRARECVALTCYELLPQQCHRLCVAEALECKFGKAFAAKHL